MDIEQKANLPIDPLPTSRRGPNAHLPASLIFLVGLSALEERDLFLRSLHGVRLGLLALNLLLTIGLGWWGLLNGLTLKCKPPLWRATPRRAWSFSS